MSEAEASAFIDLQRPGEAPLRIEYRWVGPDVASPATFVFLHEGLGSIAMWKDFPDRLCAALGAGGLVYSRPGYGRSTPRPAGERWAPDFMHRQADDLLPRLLAALGVHRPWLFGHSDGGSIALLHAARWPVAGAIVVAPHVFVEAKSIASIEAARRAYESGGLRQRLSRYHDDVDSAFRGWNDIWLDPAFRDWNIEAELDTLPCPLLAVQGVDDEYGSLEQIRRIQRRLPRTELLEIPGCGHSPHRDCPDRLIAAAQRFVHDATPAGSRPLPAA